MPLPFSRDQDRPWVAAGDLSLEFRTSGWNEPGPVERANLLQPQMVREIADAFLAAGAEVLITNTASANTAALCAPFESGEITSDDIVNMNREGVRIFKAAISEAGSSSRILFGAIGPCESLLSLGETNQDVLKVAYEPQARLLTDAGVDALYCGEFRELAALLCAVQAAVMTGLPVAAGMVFDCGADATETTLGVTVPQFCLAAAEAGAAMIVCDSGESPDTTNGLISLARDSCTLPVWAIVSAGVPQVAEGKVVYSDDPARYAERLTPFLKTGPSIIGGGRGTSAEHIAAVSNARDRRKGR